MKQKANNNIPDNKTVYTHLAHALARGYTDLYYVNIDTDDFIEFHTDDERGVLNEARRGSDFFEGCKRDVKLFVHEDDRKIFVKTMNPKFIKKVLSGNKVHELEYRRIIGDRTFWVSMKISRMEDDERFVVLAVSDIDEKVKHRREQERIQEERIIYARLHALTGNFIVIYVVDPETDSYREFSATNIYDENFAQAKEGKDFFGKVRSVAKDFNHPDDLPLFLESFTKENIMAAVSRGGIFTLPYRLMVEGNPVYVQMKAAMVEEKEGMRLIVGLNDVDAQVRREEELGRRLVQVQTQANVDALTGVKNKHAYLETESRMDRAIAEKTQQPFAIAIFDVNDLKKINDTAGHQAGDQCIRDASVIICNIFKHSPVFRIGGDEFTVIAQGSDYRQITKLLGKMKKHNDEAAQKGGLVIAYGMERYKKHDCMAAVFAGADHAMYQNKIGLKAQNGE